MRRLQIDINRRNRAGQTPTSYVGPTPFIGERVLAFEPEDGVCANAVVAAVNTDRRTVTLDVDWDSMRDDVLRQVSSFTGSALTILGSAYTAATGGSAAVSVPYIAAAAGSSRSFAAAVIDDGDRVRECV